MNTPEDTLRQDIAWYEQVLDRARRDLQEAEAAVRSADMEAEDARLNLLSAKARLRLMETAR